MTGKDNKGGQGQPRAQSGQREEAGRRGGSQVDRGTGTGREERVGGEQTEDGEPRARGRGYLRKASSGVGPRLGWATGPSEETSTRRLPAPAGAWGAAGGGAARSPRRSAEGEGVDCRKYSHR